MYVMVESPSPIGLSTNINLVESPIEVSTGRKSNQGDLGIALGSEIWITRQYDKLYMLRPTTGQL